MTKQPEHILEENLVAQLQELGYEKVVLNTEADLIRNLKTQLEKHNNTILSDTGFKQVLNELKKGNIFQKATTLRDKIQYSKDDGSTGYIEPINKIHWCKNQYQVAQQLTIKGKYQNRYDVTLLINGLPLVQIELKRRGLELKEAFNQIRRYQGHSYYGGSGLFQYVQIFVISNGVNTKYYANTPASARSFKQTFYWADKQNNKVTQLSRFAEAFLEPCHISKMITKYVVLQQSEKILMVLRPYQYHATEAIIERVKNSRKYGYIWHTTGSGKTLTSFKTSQILTHLEEVYKVIFVVDRIDLDVHTIREFNSFSEGSVDATTNTKKLVAQLTDDTRLIVTTLQKLNSAIYNRRYQALMEKLQDKRIVFIFDECHRSQFGDTHRRIKAFFKQARMFGFTGTPIFAENAVSNALGKRTTTELFDECLHKYVITDAIKDQNVLKFSIEYIRTFKSKDEVVDIPVDGIDKTEVMEAPERLEAIVNYIIAHHNRKTHDRRFTAIFCTANIKTLIRYYELFKAKKEAGQHDLKVAAIFSYQANEDMDTADGAIPEEVVEDMEDYEDRLAAEPGAVYQTPHSRDKLEAFIADYNAMYNTNYSTGEFYTYFKDIGKRVKNKEVDILLVVNMYLTGFDSKSLNTIYVDKNLKYHGLIQAYSRTNRILNERKSQGNVVAFRNLKEATDQAIALFSKKEAIEEIVIKPYREYIALFSKAFAKLLTIAPTIDSVNDLPSENEELEFVKAFRELMRTLNVLKTFTEFTFEDLPVKEQVYENYKSKYLDLHDKVKFNRQKENVSILDDIDFELELIRRDEINVAYILNLLAKLKEARPKEREKQRKVITDMLTSEAQLRSKKELIEKFILENLPLITDTEDIPEAFEAFWTAERQKAMEQLSAEENLDPEKLQGVISNYLFTEKTPLREELIAAMNQRPALRERAAVSQRITAKIMAFVETFINGMG